MTRIPSATTVAVTVAAVAVTPSNSRENPHSSATRDRMMPSGNKIGSTTRSRRSGLMTTSLQHARAHVAFDLPERERVPSVSFARVPPEEDRNDESPQDQAAGDLHDQPGEELIGDRRDAPDARERLVYGIERGPAEREKRRRDRRSERLNEQVQHLPRRRQGRPFGQRREHRPPHHDRRADDQDVKPEMRELRTHRRLDDLGPVREQQQAVEG